MRCSICDWEDAKWSFHNWHCKHCADSIRETLIDFEFMDADKEEGEVEYEVVST